MKKLRLLLVIVPIIAFGQVTLEDGLKMEIVIDGNVSDVNGIPLTDVTLLIKGTSNVTKTNFDGNFNLTAEEEEAVLIISYPGFKTKEITVGNQIKINITLEDEVKSEKKRALTKSDIRKKRRIDRKAKHNAQRAKNVEDLDEWLLKAAGRSVKGAIRKKRNN